MTNLRQEFSSVTDVGAPTPVLVASTELSVRLLEPSDTSAWDAFAAAQPEATLYHLSPWRDVMARAFGHETYYLYAVDQHQTWQGILPLVRVKTRIFGDYLVSMPYFNYGGVVARSEATADMLMQAAGELALKLGARHIEFRHTQPRAERWPVRTDKVVMELALPTSADVLWSALGSKLRAQIKRPTKENITARWGGAELLDEFYGVFARNMRDLGTPVYARSFFAAILEAFPRAASIVVAHYRGEPVAAGFLLGHGDRLEIPWAASVRDYNTLGPNMLMYWEALQKGIADGFRIFDFGRSSLDSGTYRFKKQWGAVERPLWWHYWLRPGTAMPNLTPNNAKYQLAIKMWQRLPLFVANRIGPLLIKGLP